MLLDIIQVILGSLLVIAILLQNRGAGLGAAFGGESAIYHTKRGAEKGLYVTSIILSVLFLAIALINVIY